MFVSTKLKYLIMNIKTIAFILLSILAILVGLYPLSFLWMGVEFDLLNTKSPGLLVDIFWQLGFYCHLIFGGIALLVGWIGFIKKIRTNNIRWHRLVGKIYVISAILSALGGIYIALFATGGIVNSVGFLSLGFIWLYTTGKAYLEIRKKNIIEHQSMMIYSYAACFSAVTLRIWLPLLIYISHDFELAYAIVAWISWIPNLLVAHYLVKKRSEL